MEMEHEPGTSVSTIRGLHRLNTLTLTMPDSSSKADTQRTDASGSQLPSRAPSPHSGLPSPSSPSGDSVSSFPSVSSSFLFSSGPGSPPHPSHLLVSNSSFDTDFQNDLHDSTRGLIIPSLALPSPSRRPTPYGQTLGDLRLLILAPRRAASSTAALVASLLEDNDDIVDLGAWEELHDDGDSSIGGEKASVLRASTRWVEHRDAHGLDRIEPARNVEIVELPGYDPTDDAQSVTDRTLPFIHAQFAQVVDALNPEYGPSDVLANLLSSPCTPLYTAMLLLLTSSPTPMEKALLDALSPYIPLIVIPPLSTQPSYSYHTPGYASYHSSSYSSAYASPVNPAGASSPVTTAPLSAFRPSSPDVLRSGLFRTPETLAHIRAEAVARFLRWREVERAVDRIISTSAGECHPRSSRSNRIADSALKISTTSSRGKKGKSSWNKAQWEAEWEGSLSEDIAMGVQRRKRADTALPPHPQEQPSHTLDGVRPPVFSDMQTNRMRRLSQTCAPAPFDPLHIQSLFMFSLSLLGPLRARVAQSLSFGLIGRRAAAEVAESEPAVEKTESGTKKHGAHLSFGLGLALVSAFCAGIGIGLLVARG